MIDTTVFSAGLPEAPRDVIVKENTPNMVILEILPPVDNSGLDIVGYRVEYDSVVEDFLTGYTRVLRIVLRIPYSNFLFLICCWFGTAHCNCRDRTVKFKNLMQTSKAVPFHPFGSSRLKAMNAPFLPLDDAKLLVW